MGFVATHTYCIVAVGIFSTFLHFLFYKVYRKNDKERRLDLLFEEKEWMSSLEFAMEAIVSELLKRKFIS